MKKLILTGLSLIFAITLTFAQEAKVEQKAQETVVILTEKLTLTDDQQAAVYPIVLEVKTAKLALKADTALSAEQLQKELVKISSAADMKIAAQLTEEQKVAFTKYVEERNAEKK